MSWYRRIYHHFIKLKHWGTVTSMIHAGFGITMTIQILTGILKVFGVDDTFQFIGTIHTVSGTLAFFLFFVIGYGATSIGNFFIIFIRGTARE